MNGFNESVKNLEEVLDNDTIIASKSIDKDIYNVVSEAILRGNYKFLYADSFVHHVNKRKDASLQQIYDNCSDEIIAKVEHLAQENDSPVVIMNVFYSSKGLLIDLNYFYKNHK